VLAIEDCLIGKVSMLFRSSKVLEMSPEDISRLAGETTESSVERKRLVEKHKILNAGLRGLKGLQKQRKPPRPAEWDSVSSKDVEGNPDMTVLSPEKASISSSVRGPSPVISSQGKVDPSLDGDFELPAVPRTKQWMVQEPQTTRNEEWELASL
jgi:hypothetical protein